MMKLASLRSGMVLRVKLLNNTFVGVCISKKASKSILLRNVVDGEGVEFLFNLSNPLVNEISLVKGYYFSDVRQKLYYLRQRRKSKTKIKWL